MKLATTLALLAAFTLPAVAQPRPILAPVTTNWSCPYWMSWLCGYGGPPCPEGDSNGCGIFSDKSLSLYEAALKPVR